MSKDRSFGLSTALFHVTMYRQYARKVGTSANLALIRYYLPRLKLSIALLSRKRGDERLLIPKFMEHCFVKRMQATSYNDERDVAEHAEDDTKAFPQGDFSENYTCVFQDEIQSAHWKQAQVSLFTAALWCTGSQHPIVLASDNLNHSKETINLRISTL